MLRSILYYNTILLLTFKLPPVHQINTILLPQTTESCVKIFVMAGLCLRTSQPKIDIINYF